MAEGTYGQLDVQVAETPNLQTAVTHHEAKTWYDTYIDEKGEQNDRARRDRDFYDGIQWEEGDKVTLKKRDQPVLTFNRIQPKLNSILGMEISTRVDPEALPRTPHHEDSRYAVTDILRYLDDKLEFDKIRSYCTEDSFSLGCCASVVGWDGSQIFDKRIPWRQFWYDPRSLEPDFSDAHHLGTHMWWNLRDALEDPLYGATEERRRLLEESVTNTWATSTDGSDHPAIWSDDKLKRVKIVEVYWFEQGYWWVGHMVASDWVVEPEICPYMTDDDPPKPFCPVTATSCYVVGENEETMGERYGIIRGWISAQKEINARRSKWMFSEQVSGAIAEDGAIPNEDAFRHAMARPDGIAKVRQGALRDGSIQLRDNRDIAQGNLQLLQNAYMEIDNSGPSLPVTAGDDSVLSGRAILAKQNIGSKELSGAFDRIRQWQKENYRKWWWLVRMHWTEEMHLRVTDSQRKEGFRFVRVNQVMTRAERVRELMQKPMAFPDALRSVGLPAGVGEMVMAQATQEATARIMATMQAQGINPQQLPPPMQKQIKQMQQQMVVEIVLSSPPLQEQFKNNDIASLCMDIVIDTQPDTSIAAQEELMELMDMFGRKQVHLLPKPILIAIIKNSNLRSKQDLIEALSKPPDPMQVQMRQAQMEMAIKQAQAQIEELMAQVQLTKAKTMTEQASAAEKAAKAQVGIPAEAEKDRAVGMHAAAEAGNKTAPVGPLPQ